MKRQAPAVARNKQAIAAVLSEELPSSGTVLEVASGSGEHALHFASAFAQLRFQPSDPDPVALASIEAWRADAALDNLAEPIHLDASQEQWPILAADALLCINMVHISPACAAQGLMCGAGRILPQGAPLILYGPYLEDGVETAPSNLAFDQSLQARNPQWGIKRAEWMDGLAKDNGFARTRRVAMPANNIMLVYRRV